MTEKTIQTLINTFTPKADNTDKLLELQLEEIAKMRGKAGASGWLGNEVYRATDGSQLVIVTRFRSEEARNQWTRSPEFAEHLERIDPLVERVDSMHVDLAGTFRGTDEDVPLRLAVIIGSTREGRFSEKPASWIAEKATSHGGFDVSEIDLRDLNLPFLGDPQASKAQKQAAETFGARMAQFDAYLFTVAEYNHGPTAVLKNALDHGEWGRKPAALVGYGGVGGARAVEHVRGIAAELEMMTVQSAVHINFGDYLPVAKGEKTLAELIHLEDSAEKMLEQLLWWGRALRAARTKASVE